MEDIYGYYFAVEIKETDVGYTATAPGVGGVYEEGETRDEAIANAYKSACVILEARIEHKAPITEDNPYLVVLREVPSMKNIANITEIPDGYISTPHCLDPVLA